MLGVPRSRVVWFVLIAAVGCAVDLATKSWVFRWLGPPGHSEPWWLIEGYFGLQTSLNEGALFGIGQGQVVLFAGLSLAAAVGIPVWLFVFGAARDGWINVALSLIVAGILGNLYDRLGLWWTKEYAELPIPIPQYAVRDWILWQYGQWRWPNFNLADSFLVTGTAMILVEAIVPPKQKSVDSPMGQAT